jgi:hypothetical protein
VVHLGKLYPRYNPARRLVADAPFPDWPATEYSVLTGYYLGADGVGLPLSYRGLLPVTYDPAAAYVDYQITQMNSAGKTVISTLRIGWSATIVATYAIFSVTVNAVEQINCPITDWGTAPLSSNLFVLGADYSGASGWTCLPGSVWEFTAVPWTASPKPPHSSPF